jgi:DNA mismatch repair ATPase MutS
MGAVSTHDLELGTSPKLEPHRQLVNFRESITGTGSDRRMTFDYKMRSGLAKTTNALKLLELIGLK